MILSVQCSVGTPGSKPVTQLKYPSGPFFGLVNTGKKQYGVNDGGIQQLNYSADDGTVTDDGQAVSYSLRLNASDFGISWNMKKIMYVYSVMNSASDCYSHPEITLKPDDQDEFSLSRSMVTQKTLLTPVKCRCQGTYWTVGLDSETPFTLLSMSINYITRSSGISNRC